MAFYPDVVPGTTFVPIASLENQVRRNINALNGIGGSAIKDKSLSTVRIRVYNNTELTLPAGTAVGFILSSALVGDAVPAEAVKDISKPWGVLADSLKPNDIGDCIISGPVTVDCTGTGAFALPDINTPDVFKLGSTGAPVLFSADGRAMINLGASSGGGTETIINIDLYTQQWIVDVDAGTCTCTGGYLVVNNAFLINLAGSVVNFSAANNNEVLVCQINPDFSIQWVWGASGSSDLIVAKPSIVCFLLSLGTNIQLKINARFYEYVTYIATNPVIGV